MILSSFFFSHFPSYFLFSNLSTSCHAPPSLFLALTGDFGLRLAGAGDEVDWPADAGAPDVPDAPEHNSALRQTQPQDQHLPVRP